MSEAKSHGHHLDLGPILEQVRRIPELKASLKVVLDEWAKRLEDALNSEHGKEEVLAVANEMKTELDSVFAAMVESSPIDPNNPFNAQQARTIPVGGVIQYGMQPAVAVQRPDPPGFKRQEEISHAINPFSGKPSQIQQFPDAQHQLPDSIANQTPQGVEVDSAKLLADSSKVGELQAPVSPSQSAQIKSDQAAQSVQPAVQQSSVAVNPVASATNPVVSPQK